MLQFDKTRLANEILDKLKPQIEYACIAWKTEVLSKLKHNLMGTDDNARVDYEIKKESNTIIAYLKANTYVLADSYGTGSLALTSNPGYETYRSNVGDGQGQWNPSRTSRAIMGRPEGDYVDLFGRKKHSSGYMEGYDIEGWEMQTGFKIEPVDPSYAIQMAYQWLYATYLPNAYKLAIREVNFSKYLKES